MLLSIIIPVYYNEKSLPILYERLNKVSGEIKDVDFLSPNHVTRYLVWKKFGYLPVGTDILERLEMLKETPSGRLELPIF